MQITQVRGAFTWSKARKHADPRKMLSCISSRPESGVELAPLQLSSHRPNVTEENGRNVLIEAG